MLKVLPRLQAAAGMSTAGQEKSPLTFCARHLTLATVYLSFLEGEGESSDSSKVNEEGRRTLVYSQRDVILYALSSEFFFF